MQKRCAWVNLNDKTYVDYHDNEWGKPLHDEQSLFELFSLETQAAGLSWITVLKKRDGYREAFDDFDIKTVASYDEAKIEQILQLNVIKHRKKLEAIVHNAKAFLKIIDEFNSLDKFFWSYVNFAPIINEIKDSKDAPTTSEISDNLTKELKKRGFKFVGSVTIYAFMQACGMVNDHELDCFAR